MIHAITTAYRADIGPSGEAFGPHDDEWIAIASLVSQACVMPEAERQELLDHAVTLTETLLGDDVVRLAEFEFGNASRIGAETILVLADQIFQSGALHLSRAVIDGLLDADASLTPLQQGRVLAKRARIDARLGRSDEAADQYREVARLGRRIGSGELRIRAWIGHAVLAQMRGNYPQQMRYCRRAARLADRLELPFLRCLAHTGLMITAGAQHRFDDAFRHAGIAYQHAIGIPLREAEILGNIGQLLLEAGHASLAERAFINLLNRSLPIRILLPALGGLAIASATRRDAARVRWVYAELERLQRETHASAFDVATAFLEVATSLARLEQASDAQRAVETAVRIAQARGYYEIIVKADELLRDARSSASRGQRQPTPSAQRLTDYIDATGEVDLPEHVAVAGAAQ